MSNIRRAVILSSLGRYLLMFIGLVSSMVIARLLTPSEIGVFAVASSLVMIMAEFRVLGANAYLVREKELTNDKIRSSYGLTLLVSCFMGISIVVAAFPLSDFFEIDELGGLFMLLSVSFFIAPYISIPHAILSRKYKFGLISNVYIAASISQFAITVILISFGFSFYSLAIGNLVAVFIQAVLFLYASRNVSVYRPKFNNMRVIAKVGVYTSLGHVIRKAQQTAPDMVLGKMGTPAEVGMFSRGLGLMVFVTETIMSGIHPVAAPYLADINNRGDDVVKAYLNASQLITGVLWPVLAVGSVASLPAIRLMFGDQWDAAAPIASVVAVWAMLRAPHILAPQALITLGYESSMFAKELIVFIVFLAAIILGYYKEGMQGAAYGFVVGGATDLVVSAQFVKARINIKFFKHFLCLVPSLMVTVCCWAAVQGIAHAWPFEEVAPFYSFLQIIILLPLAWFISLFVFRHPLRAELIKVFPDHLFKKQ
ncbi:oligosaccharide flippase family protein [Marinobacter sp. DY40_1A1]|uniref:oligosaccharide flippase family protein n=1 Tax=Marinobacter sp. DY40_1A1 TaxID=2583229 RepID=UPI0019033F6D|nr:oligosaccharide flippase family protein [Marinobacter sp. DY40_1A1]MBK1885937.1 oligosaccharide flippase family protein [Marinobacter sp. DY40_1A1]